MDKKMRSVVRTTDLTVWYLQLNLWIRGYLLTIFGILSRATTKSLLLSS